MLIKYISSIFILLFFYGCGMDLTNPGDKISTHKSTEEKETEAAQIKPEDREITAKEFIKGENLEKIANQTQLAQEASLAIGPKTSDNITGIPSRRVVIQEFIQIDDYEQLINKKKYDSFLVTVNFKNTDINQVIETFAEISGENILIGDEIEGMVTASITNEPWLSAFEAILDMKEMGLLIDQETNLMRVHSRTVIQGSQTYEQAKLTSLKTKMDSQKALKPKRSELFKLYYVGVIYMKERLTEILQAGLSSGEGGQTITTSDVSIAADTIQNALIINATADDLNLIERVVDEIDKKVDQVLIEAIIIEATDLFDEQLGARLGFSYVKPAAAGTGIQTVSGIGGGSNIADVDGTLELSTAAATTVGATGNISDFSISGASAGVGMIYDIGLAALKLEIYAMEKEGLTKIVSNPKVFTLNNKEASILKGKQIQYTAAEGDMQFKSVGLQLVVTPQIVGDGNIILQLGITNDDVAAAGSNPPLSKLEIKTNLIVQDGSVVAIGGIYTQNESVSASKIPILGDIPILGRLFRKDSMSDNQTQIIIFIAPKVV